MLVRKLTERDLDAYWGLRLRALLDNPEAFGATYEETVARGKERMRGRLRPSGDSFTLGAFEDETLVGTVRFHREDEPKIAIKPSFTARSLHPKSVDKVSVRP